ncbi:hypothetical protein H4I96_06044 [Botrytis cinerea]
MQGGAELIVNFIFCSTSNIDS